MSTLENSNKPAKKPYLKRLLIFVLLVVVAGAWYQFGNAETLAWLASQENSLREFQTRYPVLIYAIAFCCYVLITGLSLPGAAIMTLMFGWYFGWWRSVILVSFASTTGATVSFLISRHLLRESVQNKFDAQLKSFNSHFEKEGAFYLFTLRLIPQMPFFVVNLVMGLTKIGTWTFWWVSQLGMFAGTVVYCYAGSRIPDLQTLTNEGILSVFDSSQLAQLTIAFILLGTLPLAAKFFVNWLRVKNATEHQSDKNHDAN